MKKTLVALAALAATSAFAQSSVTLYGVFDAGYSDNTKTINGVKYGQKAVTYNNYATSRLGFKGTEDLGGGMKANFVIETGLSSNTTTGTNAFLPGVATAPGSVTGAAGDMKGTAGTSIDATSIGNREFNAYLTFPSRTMVGVGFGSTGIRDTTLNYAADGGINTVGNILVNDNQLGSNRTTAINVRQPFGTGFVASVGVSRNLSTQDGVADNKTGNFSGQGTGYMATLKYENGPLSTALAYQTVDTVTATTTTPSVDRTIKSTVFGISYALPVAKLFGQYAEVRTDDSAAVAVGEGKRRGYSIGAQFPLGAATPFLQYSRGDKNEVYNAGFASEKRDYTGYSLGVNYAFSKRTSAYIVAGRTNLEAGSGTTANTGVEVKNTEATFGVVHSF